MRETATDWRSSGDEWKVGVTSFCLAVRFKCELFPEACTRAEIMDYHHRLSRYGQEIADKKRPNPFTFEIWDFMQEAKKTCRSEAMEGVDYSKVQLALEDGVPDGVSLDGSDDDNNDW